MCDAELVSQQVMIVHGWVVKVVAGVGEENNWCLDRFKGWFR